jgi:hypothetical protein
MQVCRMVKSCFYTMKSMVTPKLTTMSSDEYDKMGGGYEVT